MAALAWLHALPAWAAIAAVAALVGAAGWTAQARGSRAQVLAAAWPVVHLLLALTGSLVSSLLALPAAWAVAFGRAAPRLRWAGVAAAALLVPAVHVLHRGLPASGDVIRFELLMLLAAAFLAARRAVAVEDAPDADDAKPADAAPSTDETDAQTLATALELARRATDAHEASLWRRSADGRSASIAGRAAGAHVPVPDGVVALEGHPFGWAVMEQQHLHLQRGKRELPSAWAAEMLLVPVEGDGVLALAYPGGVPPGADAAALDAGRHLGALAGLLRLRGSRERDDARVHAIAEAARTLPGEIEVDAFARRLAAVVRQGTGAAGAAVALGLDDAGRGKVLHVDDTGPSPHFAPEGFGEGESRLALALKAGVDLTWADLRGEKDRLPLCTPGEKWEMAPRSAAVYPLVADGRAIGGVVAWHPEPGRFGEAEGELLRQLCSIAPLPLRSARQYQALDQRAHTDALTGLPNRGAFEERLAATSNVFDRYARPFGVMVLDVDFFKKFNDTHGHEAGDRVLRHVAQLVQLTVRDVDLAARLGGEEFVVLLPETGLRASADAAERIRRAVEARPATWNGTPLPVTVSVGVAACPECTTTPGEVLRLADEALYRAKGEGRNRVATAPRTARPEAGV